MSTKFRVVIFQGHSMGETGNLIIGGWMTLQNWMGRT